MSPIRLIDQDNHQVGEIDTREALRMAEEAGLDLVEIQPDVRPPLCKIMDYGKYKYEQSKKNKGSGAKQQELKEVRLGRSAKIDPHDVEIRVKQARRFLMEGHKVQLVQQVRGREMAHKEIGLDRLRKIADDLADISKVESPPKHVGRRVLLMLAPDKPKIESVKRKLEAAKAKENGPKKGPESEPASDAAKLDGQAAKPEPAEQPETANQEAEESVAGKS